MAKRAPHLSRRDQRRRCPFCGDPADSDQHLFKAEFAKRFPPTAPGRVHYIRRPTDDLPEFREKPNSPPNARKVRVCGKRCNNGWMHTVEKRAFETVCHLAAGDDITMTSEQAAHVAALIALMAMVGEFVTDMIGISQQERDELRATLQPPAAWRIYVGRCRPAAFQYRHRHTPTGFGVLGRPAYQAQASTFSFGELVAHARSSPHVELRSALSDKLIQVWPPASEAARAWRDCPMLSDDEVIALEVELRNRYRSLGGTMLPESD